MNYHKELLDHPYLEQMKSYPHVPEYLWVRGELPDCPEKRPKSVAIIGARRCTSYGQDAAYRLAFELAKLGVVIISGMAYGIDSCAHRGCLDAGGTTIAVLGTPIDQIYPKSNTGLAERILEKGAIVSEYNPGTEAKKYYFLSRNRIVSGLADVVVVIEAALHSGTNYTASVASGEQNKDVFAMPGDITRPMSAGCNQLIRNGALVYMELSDILCALGINGGNMDERDYKCENASERLIINLLKSGEKDILSMISETKLSVPELIQVLTNLEMKNYVKTAGNDRWALA